MSFSRSALLLFLAAAFLWACGAEEKPVPASGPRLSITELFTFTDSDYRFHVTGKVKNFSAANADEIVVTTDFFSDPDHQLPILSGSQSLSAVPGGEGFRTFDIWSPSVRLLPGAGGYPAIFYETQVRGAAAGNESLPVPVLEFDYQLSDPDIFRRYHVRAKITNRGTVPVDMVYLTVFFFRDEALTDPVARLRRGFGRFLGTPERTPDNITPASPVYVLDLWHPEITSEKYPRLYIHAELTL